MEKKNASSLKSASSLDGCTKGKEAFVKAFDSAFENEYAEQQSHDDFKGEKKYKASCPRPNGKSKEVWSREKY